MQVFNYSIAFDKLNLSASDLLENSGQFDVEQSTELLSIAAEAFEIGEKLASIKGGIVLCNIEINGDFLKAGSLELKPGKKITRLMKQARLGAFFVCTAGKGFEDVSQQLMAQGKLIEGYYIDLLGSMTVEAAMDHFQKEFEQTMGAEGYRISNRYSPGYCDWHVSEQHLLFNLFPDNFCGVGLSKSALMSPIKSISGIIGVGSEIKFRDHHCDQCNSHTCIYRNINPNKKRTH